MLNVFRTYPTYQIFVTAVLALVITAILTPLWTKLLRSRGIGQVIRIDGPQRHLLKAGTPTMGGVLVVLTLVGLYFLMTSRDMLSMIALLTIVSSGLVGFVDDYSKVVRARSLGLKARSKFFWHFIIATGMGLAAINLGALPTGVSIPGSNLVLDLGRPALNLALGGGTFKIPFLYVLFVYLVFTSTANTVNLTDGLDGLAAGTIAISMLAYAAIAFRQDRLDLAIICAAVGGACIGFLWYNCYPAEIFFGDTGSLALGGAIATLAILTKTELLLLLIGGIYVIEGLSVIGQIISFRWFGVRILKMAPIHHHFEIMGWSETQVMLRFWIIAGLLSGAGFAIYFATAPGR